MLWHRLFILYFKIVMEKSRILETSLVLTTFALVVFLVTGWPAILFVATGIGFTGIFVRPVAGLIAKGWFAFSEVLSFVTSKIILGTLFFVVLVPIAFFYRMFNADKLQIRKKYNSTWKVVEKTYNGRDLQNIW